MTDSALAQWLQKQARRGKRVKKGDLARDVECSPARLSQILHHGAEPSLGLAVRLSRRTGIPVDRFVKQREVAQ
jgi:transcriptional regulator with XRE-family HTH domain